jgi:murein DD-endopeptidase MepM/ murein hydrolase activator NlpD
MKNQLMTTGRSTVAILSIITLLGTPFASEAWFFPAASAQTFSDGVINNDSSGNAQNMELLSSLVAMISNQKAFDPNDEILITDEEALSPEVGSSGTRADLVDIPAIDTISTYIVQKGDTIAAVAKRFSVSENTIRWANNFNKKDVLHVGQTIVILPITGVKHIVQKGETLASIAKKYKADAGDIADYNNMDVSDSLSVGTLIIVPDGEITITKVVTDSKTGKKRTIVDTGSAVKGGTSVSRGYYIRPVVLGSGIQKTQGFHDRYNAVDIGAPKGTPIHAMASGTVIVAKESGWNGGYGGLTIIAHPNGTQTLYAHQSRVDVSVGQQVSQGQVIGGVGNTGSVHGRTGLHLHFEIRGVSPTPILY